jgi:AcrR family transcriptional regulator
VSRADNHNTKVRRRVLDAWGEVMTENGYDAATVGEVAVKAGLARSSVYRYFPDKEILFFAYIEDRIAAFVEALRTEVYTETDAPSRLRRLVIGELHRFSASPEIGLSDVPESLSREGRTRLLTCFEPLRSLVREILEQGQADGTMGPFETDQAMEMVFACIDVFRVRLARQWLDPDAIADEIAEFVLRGLGVSRRAPDGRQPRPAGPVVGRASPTR